MLRLPGRASVTDRMRDDLHWLDVSKRVTFKHRTGIVHLHCTGIQVSDRSRTILANVVVCAVVDRAGSCQPQISKHEHHASSTNKNKNDWAARIFLLLPSGMEQSPLLLESWTNRCSFSRKTLKRFFFKINSLVTVILAYSYTFSLSIFWQLLWGPPWWTFIRSSIFQMSVYNYNYN